ncbi:MAG: hypothetical protein QOA17_09945 [Nitrososphaeraceae archaeon]|nr:hypothetical protein [Nitrososphaeraceae archaeon]
MYDSLLQIKLSPESNLTTGGICGHWASWLDAHPHQYYFVLLSGSLFSNSFRCTVEVRHPSWFSDLAYNFFSNNNNNICMTWNQLDKIQSPPIVTTDFVS